MKKLRKIKSLLLKLLYILGTLIQIIFSFLVVSLKKLIKKLSRRKNSAKDREDKKVEKEIVEKEPSKEVKEEPKKQDPEDEEDEEVNIPEKKKKSPLLEAISKFKVRVSNVTWDRKKGGKFYTIEKNCYLPDEFKRKLNRPKLVVSTENKILKAFGMWNVDSLHIEVNNITVEIFKVHEDKKGSRFEGIMKDEEMRLILGT